MYKDIDETFAKRSGVPYTGKFLNGLPIGLKLSNGVVVGS